MNIVINDQTIALQNEQTLSSILSAHVHTDGVFAVAVNKIFIPKHAYDHTLIKQHDRIDIVIPMQGG